MKKYLLVLAALAAAAISCQKNEAPVLKTAEDAPQGVFMSLSADLVTTKLSTAEEDGAMKVAWEKGDTVSVLSFAQNNVNAALKTVDPFVYNSANKTFQGYYTGGDNPRIGVVYPQVKPDLFGTFLTEGEFGGHAYNNNTSWAISGLKIDGQYCYFNTYEYPHVMYSNDLRFVRNNQVLWGLATKNGDELTASLSPIFSIIRFNLVFPTNGDRRITRVTVKSTQNTFSPSTNTWSYAANMSQGLSSYFSIINCYLGGIKDGKDKYDNTDGFDIPSDNIFTFYYVGALRDQSAGAKWTVDVYDGDTKTYTRTVTFGSGLDFSTGNYYKMAVNLTSTAAPEPPTATNLSPANQTANCYVVPSAGTYKFKNCKGREFNLLNSTATSAEVLWEALSTDDATSEGDLIKSIELYDDGYVYVTTADSYKNGNALVAVKDESHNILWSWHLWFTDEDLDATAKMVGLNTAWMFNNLGAFGTGSWTGEGDINLGLLYQHGRKDPFPGFANVSGSTAKKTLMALHGNTFDAVDTDAVNGTEAFANSHPMTFIRPEKNHYVTIDGEWDTYDAAETKGDWLYGTPQDPWATDTYDPCPYGWSIPYSNDFSKLNNSAELDGHSVSGTFILRDSGTWGLFIPYTGILGLNGEPSKYLVPRTSSYTDEACFWTKTGNTSERKYKYVNYWYNSAATPKSRVFENSTNVGFLDHPTTAESEYIWERLYPANGLSIRCVKRI